jgi:hypothetical protein
VREDREVTFTLCRSCWWLGTEVTDRFTGGNFISAGGRDASSHVFPLILSVCAKASPPLGCSAAWALDLQTAPSAFPFLWGQIPTLRWLKVLDSLLKQFPFVWLTPESISEVDCAKECVCGGNAKQIVNTFLTDRICMKPLG